LSDEPIMELIGATKEYHTSPIFGARSKIPAMSDVSFSLYGGKALALVGESGSGKSTCARAIARLFALTAGRIVFRGTDIASVRGRQAALAYSRAVQMVFQDPFSALNPTHTVRHHLIRPVKLHGGAKESAEGAVRSVLADVELDPDETIDKYPHELSGGERQRVNLARALAVGAEVIVADEPTSMLDVSIRRSVLDLMRRLKDERGLSFLYITHDIATGSYFAEDMAVMFAGRIVERGPSETIIRDPRHPYTQLLLSALPNPGMRMGSSGGSRDFSRRADAVRHGTRNATEALTEISPGHFVRPWSDCSVAV
jgi:peptide/nickel transport system ATP-binding protein